MKRMNIALLCFLVLLMGHEMIAANKSGTRSSIKNKTIGVESAQSLKTGNVGDAYAFQINNVHIPLDNKGILGDVSIDGLTRGEYDGKGFLFSSGFLMSGKADTGTGAHTWANGVASASRIWDYMPGPVSSPNDPNAKIYVVSSSDPAHGQSWQDWSSAVALGADFVDVDSNGVYDPAVDKPDMPGDLTAWCVYNDGVPSAQRGLFPSTPCGIEIQQTIWGYEMGGPYGNVLFVRYRIIGRELGKYSGTMDSVYFGVWADPDIGDYTEDMVGCDTILSSGYGFSDGYDAEYGINPPCFLMRFLQGPVTYIPGVTFTDLNFNGKYDEGIDTPLMTATESYGSDKGTKLFPGAKNLELSSFINYVQSDPNRGDPGLVTEARYYMRGLLKGGQPLDPCSDAYGSVVTGSCSAVNNKFWYSGDPVTNTGWLYNTPRDIRIMSNVGPFNLEKDKPIDIIVGYVVGRGTDALNSITEAKSISSVTKDFLDGNFEVPGVTVNVVPGPMSADLKIRCDGSRMSATAVVATLKTKSGTVIGTLPLFDDGTHQDSTAGDLIFGNSTSVLTYQDPITLDLSVTVPGGMVIDWPEIKNITTTALGMTATIASDNLNNDHLANPGEVIRFVITIDNWYSFWFTDLKIEGTPHLTENYLSVDSLASHSSHSFSYDSTTTNTYLDFWIPVDYSEAEYSIALTATDDRGNIWNNEVKFPMYPFTRQYSTVQTSGPATGAFSILITNPAEVKSHLYVIHGVDSIDTLGTPGFTLRDSTAETVLLQNHPLPDQFGFNISPVDGFKIFKGTMEYQLTSSSWALSDGFDGWFVAASTGSGSVLSCGAYLAPDFYGAQQFVASGSTVSRSRYDSVQVKFSKKTGYTDSNSDGHYDIGEPYTFDTTNLDYCQKAHFIKRNALGTKVLYDGFKWIPFAASNLSTGKRLNIVIYDNDKNGQWDIDSASGGKKNFAWIMESVYDSTGAIYDSTRGGMNLLPAFQNKTSMPSMWMLWMKSNGMEPYGEQGGITLVPTYPISSRNSFLFDPTIVGVRQEHQNIPREFSLEQNYPNPFNPTTTISFSLRTYSHTSLRVYDLLGREVATLVNEKKPAGSYSVPWNASGFASGVYFYRLRAGDFVQTKKLLLIK